MDFLEFTIGFVGMMALLAVVYFLAKQAWKDVQEHELPLLDYGALEADLTDYVQADLNSGKRAA